jgi:hypothetical protein
LLHHYSGESTLVLNLLVERQRANFNILPDSLGGTMKKLAVVLAAVMLAVAFASNASAFTWAIAPADIYLAGGLDVNTDGTDLESISSLADPFGGTINFTPNVERRHVPGSWTTWSHGYTGSILWSGYSQNSIRLDFDGTVTAFGGYAQPNSFDVYDITLGLSDGSNLTKSLSGNGGADFFGFYDGAVDWIEFTSPDPNGFAIGELAMAKCVVPEPGTLMLLGTGLFSLGFFRRKR